MDPIYKKPSAWIPVLMSAVVLAIFLTSIAMLGAPVHEPDEGTGAHLFQMWWVLEALMLAYFAITWLPQAPKQALLVLAIQSIAVLAACAPVFFFHL